MSIKELSLIGKVAAQAVPNRHVLAGIGDDTAVLRSPSGHLLFAADMLMDGVHFRLGDVEPELIGRKALAVNLSDIAAMAGTPIAVTVSLALPAGLDESIAERIMQGLSQLANEFDVAVCGGDTNVWNHPLVIDVAVIGETHAKGAVLRSGARPGDEIFVTGPLGGTIDGKHLTFIPRIKEAAWLHNAYKITSMIDLSDGLAKDLRHVLDASDVGATLFKEGIPKNKGKKNLPCSLEEALTGGEDFELCFTVDAETARKITIDRNYPGTGLFHIGTMTREKGLRFDDGTVVSLHGYEHGAVKSDV